VRDDRVHRRAHCATHRVQVDWSKSWTSADGRRQGLDVLGGELIEDVAARELGLDAAQADALFGEAGDLDQLWDEAELMTEGRVHRQP
jgi:hypothetical protein